LAELAILDRIYVTPNFIGGFAGAILELPG
jgi:hypothetical protein